MTTAREYAYKTLKNVEDGVKLDDAIAGTLSSSQLDNKDERFYLHLVKSTLRNRKLVDYQIELNSDRRINKVDSDILTVLRLGVLQLHLMETAEYAAVNEAVELAKKVAGKGAAGFVNGVMRSSLRAGISYPDRDGDPAEYLSVLYSHPTWLVKRWLKRFGYDETEDILKANNTNAPVTALLRPGAGTDLSEGGPLRVGPLGTYEIDLTSRLSNFGPFVRGDLLIVDPSSTLGVRALNPPPGAVVGDFAAGVGGKSIQLAWRVSESGEVVAVDNNAGRMEVLAFNLSKYNLKNVSPVLADLTEYNAAFDYILLDAPCSNSGVLRRKPDIRWRLHPKDIDEAAGLQKKLLRSAWDSLNGGGLLVYETCSMEPEENEGVIEWAIDNIEGVVIENAVERLGPSLGEEFGGGPYISTYPHIHNCNGAFAALLRRE